MVLVSLQTEARADELAALGVPVLDADPALTDFRQTAAVIAANLDLVISVDTAVAHLAGALGAPVWTLISAAPDWRWMLGREDSPWYPSMRLYRQPALDDWASVMGRWSRPPFRRPWGEGGAQSEANGRVESGVRKIVGERIGASEELATRSRRG